MEADTVPIKIEPDESESSILGSSEITDSFSASEVDDPESTPSKTFQVGQKNFNVCDENANIRYLLGKRPIVFSASTNALFSDENGNSKNSRNVSESFCFPQISKPWSLKRLPSNLAPKALKVASQTRTKVEEEWQETFKVSNDLPDPAVLFGNVAESSKKYGIANRHAQNAAPVPLSKISWKPPVFTGDMDLDKKLAPGIKSELQSRPISGSCPSFQKFSFCQQGGISNCGGKALSVGQSVTPVKPGVSGLRAEQQSAQNLSPQKVSYGVPTPVITLTKTSPVKSPPKQTLRNLPENSTSKQNLEHPSPKQSSPENSSTPKKRKAPPRSKDPATPKKVAKISCGPKKPRPRKAAKNVSADFSNSDGSDSNDNQKFKFTLGKQYTGGSLRCRHESKVPDEDLIVPMDFVKQLFQKSEPLKVDPAVGIVTQCDIKRYLGVPNNPAESAQSSFVCSSGDAQKESPSVTTHNAIRALLRKRSQSSEQTATASVTSLCSLPSMPSVQQKSVSDKLPLQSESESQISEKGSSLSKKSQILKNFFLPSPVKSFPSFDESIAEFKSAFQSKNLPASAGKDSESSHLGENSSSSAEKSSEIRLKLSATSEKSNVFKIASKSSANGISDSRTTALETLSKSSATETSSSNSNALKSDSTSIANLSKLKGPEIERSSSVSKASTSKLNAINSVSRSSANETASSTSNSLGSNTSSSLSRMGQAQPSTSSFQLLNKMLGTASPRRSDHNILGSQENGKKGATKFGFDVPHKSLGLTSSKDFSKVPEKLEKQFFLQVVDDPNSAEHAVKLTNSRTTAELRVPALTDSSRDAVDAENGEALQLRPTGVPRSDENIVTVPGLPQEEVEKLVQVNMSLSLKKKQSKQFQRNSQGEDARISGVTPLSPKGKAPVKLTSPKKCSGLSRKDAEISPNKGSNILAKKSAAISAPSSGSSPTKSTGISSAKSTGISPTKSTGISPTKSTGILPNNGTGILPNKDPRTVYLPGDALQFSPRKRASNTDQNRSKVQPVQLGPRMQHFESAQNYSPRGIPTHFPHLPIQRLPTLRPEVSPPRMIYLPQTLHSQLSPTGRHCLPLGIQMALSPNMRRKVQTGHPSCDPQARFPNAEFQWSERQNLDDLPERNVAGIEHPARTQNAEDLTRNVVCAADSTGDRNRDEPVNLVIRQKKHVSPPRSPVSSCHFAPIQAMDLRVSRSDDALDLRSPNKTSMSQNNRVQESYDHPSESLKHADQDLRDSSDYSKSVSNDQNQNFEDSPRKSARTLMEGNAKSELNEFHSTTDGDSKIRSRFSSGETSSSGIHGVGPESKDRTEISPVKSYKSRSIFQEPQANNLLHVAKDSGVDLVNYFLQSMQSIRYKNPNGAISGEEAERTDNVETPEPQTENLFEQSMQAELEKDAREMRRALSISKIAGTSEKAQGRRKFVDTSEKARGSGKFVETAEKAQGRGQKPDLQKPHSSSSRGQRLTNEGEKVQRASSHGRSLEKEREKCQRTETEHSTLFEQSTETRSFEEVEMDEVRITVLEVTELQDPTLEGMETENVSGGGRNSGPAGNFVACSESGDSQLSAEGPHLMQTHCSSLSIASAISGDYSEPESSVKYTEDGLAENADSEIQYELSGNSGLELAKVPEADGKITQSLAKSSEDFVTKTDTKAIQGLAKSSEGIVMKKEFIASSDESEFVNSGSSTCSNFSDTGHAFVKVEPAEPQPEPFEFNPVKMEDASNRSQFAWRYGAEVAVPKAEIEFSRVIKNDSYDPSQFVGNICSDAGLDVFEPKAEIEFDKVKIQNYSSDPSQFVGNVDSGVFQPEASSERFAELDEGSSRFNSVGKCVGTVPRAKVEFHSVDIGDSHDPNQDGGKVVPGALKSPIRNRIENRERAAPNKGDSGKETDENASGQTIDKCASDPSDIGHGPGLEPEAQIELNKKTANSSPKAVRRSRRKPKPKQFAVMVPNEEIKVSRRRTAGKKEQKKTVKYYLDKNSAKNSDQNSASDSGCSQSTHGSSESKKADWALRKTFTQTVATMPNFSANGETAKNCEKKLVRTSKTKLKPVRRGYVPILPKKADIEKMDIEKLKLLGYSVAENLLQVQGQGYGGSLKQVRIIPSLQENTPNVTGPIPYFTKLTAESAPAVGNSQVNVPVQKDLEKSDIDKGRSVPIMQNVSLNQAEIESKNSKPSQTHTIMQSASQKFCSVNFLSKSDENSVGTIVGNSSNYANTSSESCAKRDAPYFELVHTSGEWRSSMRKQPPPKFVLVNPNEPQGSKNETQEASSYIVACTPKASKSRGQNKTQVGTSATPKTTGIKEKQGKRKKRTSNERSGSRKSARPITDVSNTESYTHDIESNNLSTGSCEHLFEMDDDALIIDESATSNSSDPVKSSAKDVSASKSKRSVNEPSKLTSCNVSKAAANNLDLLAMVSTAVSSEGLGQNAAEKNAKERKIVVLDPMTGLPKAERFQRMVSGERQLLPDWIEGQVALKDIPGLKWYDKKKRIIQIPWRHSRSNDWNEEDCTLFERWALYTGKHAPGEAPNPKKWKTNFRCALNLYAVRMYHDKEVCLYKLYPNSIINQSVKGEERKVVKIIPGKPGVPAVLVNKSSLTGITSEQLVSTPIPVNMTTKLTGKSSAKRGKLAISKPVPVNLESKLTGESSAKRGKLAISTPPVNLESKLTGKSLAKSGKLAVSTPAPVNLESKLTGESLAKCGKLAISKPAPVNLESKLTGKSLAKCGKPAPVNVQSNLSGESSANCGKLVISTPVTVNMKSKLTGENRAVCGKLAISTTVAVNLESKSGESLSKRGKLVVSVPASGSNQGTLNSAKDNSVLGKRKAERQSSGDSLSAKTPKMPLLSPIGEHFSPGRFEAQTMPCLFRQGSGDKVTTGDDSCKPHPPSETSDIKPGATSTQSCAFSDSEDEYVDVVD